MPGRTNSSASYRYGFNGKENDNDVKGAGNQLDYGARVYDPRLGRFLSMDPLHAKHADMTPYHNATNNPVNRVDKDGNDDIHFHYLNYTVFVPNGKGGFTPQGKTITWATVVRNNLPNTFAVHHESLTLNQDGKGGSTYTDRSVQFFPDASWPKPRTGVTTSTFLGFVRADNDYTALLKTLEDFPEVATKYPPEIRNPASSGSQHERNSDFMWKALGDSKARAANEEQQSKVNALMVGVITTAASEILVGRLIAGEAVASVINNPLPAKLARVIPANVSASTLGAPGAVDVFVTAAEDIAGLNAREIANKLTIPYNKSGFKIIKFDTPAGLASPINRGNPGFVGFGRTAGGAREFVIPNQPIPSGATTTVVK